MIAASSSPEKSPSKFGYTVQNCIGKVHNQEDIVRYSKNGAIEKDNSAGSGKSGMIPRV